LLRLGDLPRTVVFRERPDDSLIEPIDEVFCPVMPTSAQQLAQLLVSITSPRLHTFQW
jgi:hypothetical protein